MHPFSGHLSGMPVEELIAGLAPMTAVMLVWVRVAGQRLRHRIERRER